MLTVIRVPISGLCPESGEPQTGSTLTLRYREPGRLDIRWIRAWLKILPADVRDLEDVVSALAKAATRERGGDVRVCGRFVLRDGMIVICQSS